MTRAAAVAALAALSAAAQDEQPYDAPPIHYSAAATADPIARLVERIRNGEVELARDAERGYLPALLAALGVPVSSQALVFSKTSFQHRRITPRTPRAVYFGDDVYVGFVPGGEVLELTGIDPVQGPVFYTLAQGGRGADAFARRGGECLTCHASARTGGWPGNLVRSVHADAGGHPLMNAPSYVIDHTSPFARRWGGWYVTGTHGAMRHMGNAVVADPTAPAVDPEPGANVERLGDRVELARYLSPHSDLVALLVLEHQAEMHNVIARASYRARRALHATGGDLDDAARHEVHDAAGEVLAYLLLRDEAPLPAPVAGTSSFAAEFAAGGPRDERGRGLRDLDLHGRLFRYPCSFVIHSPAFDAMPAPVLDVVYTRMWRILTGRIGRRSWGLDRATRQAILDILLATKQGLPAEWRPVEVR